MLILDTSILVDMEKENKEVIKIMNELSSTYSSLPSISFITRYEFQMGIKKRMFKNQQKAMQFLDLFRCLNATKDTSDILAELRYKYQNLGIEHGLADLIIATQARQNNLILVTKDKNFEKMDEIKKIII